MLYLSKQCCIYCCGEIITIDSSITMWHSIICLFRVISIAGVSVFQNDQQLDCALDLMRRLPPQQIEKNLSDLIDLVSHCAVWMKPCYYKSVRYSDVRITTPIMWASVWQWHFNKTYRAPGISMAPHTSHHSPCHLFSQLIVIKSLFHWNICWFQMWWLFLLTW